MITQGIFMANSKKEFPIAAKMLKEALAKNVLTASEKH
jgi:hypothetical protein